MNKQTVRKSKKKPTAPSNSYENYDAQLQEWSQKLEEFKTKMSQLHDDLQAEASQKIHLIEQKFGVATDRMKELKNMGLAAKDELRTGFEKAWKELLQAFEEAKKTFH